MADADDLDGCDVDLTENPTSDEDLDLFVLFAEALDPDTEVTVEGRRADWEALFT